MFCFKISPFSLFFSSLTLCVCIIIFVSIFSFPILFSIFFYMLYNEFHWAIHWWSGVDWRLYACNDPFRCSRQLNRITARQWPNTELVRRRHIKMFLSWNYLYHGMMIKYVWFSCVRPTDRPATTDLWIQINHFLGRKQNDALFSQHKNRFVFILMHETTNCCFMIKTIFLWK